MRILMLFLDGVGLGEDDAARNPFMTAHTPTLRSLTNDLPWLKTTGRQVTPRSLFIPTDPRLGVPGRPQSGTGQAAILTGVNVPQAIGEHFGPKPNPAIRSILAEASFFKRVRSAGKRAALLDAYPAGLHEDIARGKTLRSSIQQAAYDGGQELFGMSELLARQALTPEWTGQAWRTYLKLMQTPVYTPREAGHLLVELSRSYDFAMHSHWMTDHVGHRGPVARGIELLETFDEVMAGVLETWRDDEGLVIVCSDHGNLEDVGSRHHTENDVPTVIVGDERSLFDKPALALSDLVPLMARLLQV